MSSNAAISDLNTTPSRRGKRHIAAILLISIGLAAVAAIGIVFWQERSLSQAEVMLSKDRPLDAMLLVDTYLANHPLHGRALAIKARSLSKLGRADEVIHIYEHVGAAEAEDLHAWGQAYLLKGQWSRALPILERLLELEPQNADALHEVTACRTNLGQHDRALQSAAAFTALKGYEARGYLLIGTIHRNLGNTRSAIEAFSRVLEFSPDARGLQVKPDDFLLEYGKTLLADGRSEEAILQLEKANRISPRPQTYVHLGEAYNRLGRTEDAIQSWKIAVEIEPGNQDARAGLAGVALSQGQAQQALQWLKPLEGDASLRASTAYLLQRSYVALNDRAAAAAWQQRTDELRSKEQLNSLVEQVLVESPQSFWASVIRAYQFAASGNWEQAEFAIAGLAEQNADEPFLADLAHAIARRGTLPDLARLPIKQF